MGSVIGSYPAVYHGIRAVAPAIGSIGAPDAAGRAPDLEALNLAAAGVAVEHGQIVLNEFLQSVSNPAIYAAGDAAAKGPPLTPVSSHDGKIVAANILEGNPHRPDYRGVPSVAFTLPPIAAVGLSEAAAREQSPNLRMNSAKVPEWYTARRMDSVVEEAECDPRFRPTGDIKRNVLVERVGCPRVVVHRINIGQAKALAAAVHVTRALPEPEIFLATFPAQVVIDALVPHPKL